MGNAWTSRLKDVNSPLSDNSQNCLDQKVVRRPELFTSSPFRELNSVQETTINITNSKSSAVSGGYLLKSRMIRMLKISLKNCECQPIWGDPLKY
jgi:hypothetical protein